MCFEGKYKVLCKGVTGTWCSLQDSEPAFMKKGTSRQRDLTNDYENATWSSGRKRFRWRESVSMRKKASSKLQNRKITPARLRSRGRTRGRWKDMAETRKGGQCRALAFQERPDGWRGSSWDGGALSKRMKVHVLVSYSRGLSLLQRIDVLMGWPWNPFTHSFIHSFLHSLIQLAIVESLLYIRHAQKDHTWSSSPEYYSLSGKRDRNQQISMSKRCETGMTLQATWRYMKLRNNTVEVFDLVSEAKEVLHKKGTK